MRSSPGRSPSRSIRRPTACARRSRTRGSGCDGPRVSGPRRPSSAVLLVLVSLLAGCVTAVAPPRQSVPEDARRAVALLAGRWQGFSDLRALSDITVEQGGRRDRLTG